MNTLLVGLCVSAIWTPVFAQQVWPPPYAAIELMAPDDTHVVPKGINAKATITGSLVSPNISFVWRAGVGRYLHSANPLYSADANDINDAGWIVGKGGDFDGHFVPTLWIDGEPMSLGTLGGDSGEAEAVNDLGQVVGRAAAENEQSPLHAFLWSKGEMIDLGSLGAGVSFAWGVNNLGQVVGHSAYEQGTNSRGFLWDKGRMTDLGTIPGGTRSVALDINDQTQIVGYGTDSLRNEVPFLWENGSMRSLQDFDLGDGGYANRINNHGQVVGFTMFDAIPLGSHAFIWDEANGMRLIEDLIPPNTGLHIRIGRDINDDGQIALEATRGNPFNNGEYVGMLVTPVHPTMTLEAPAPGVAGVENTFTLSGATTGATVRFFYSLRGGGEIIPGCATRVNALQLARPTLLGTAVADANGNASVTALAPTFARGREVLFQAVVQGECAISELVRWEFE